MFELMGKSAMKAFKFFSPVLNYRLLHEDVVSGDFIGYLPRPYYFNSKLVPILFKIVDSDKFATAPGNMNYLWNELYSVYRTLDLREFGFEYEYADKDVRNYGVVSDSKNYNESIFRGIDNPDLCFYSLYYSKVRKKDYIEVSLVHSHSTNDEDRYEIGRKLTPESMCYLFTAPIHLQEQVLLQANSIIESKFGGPSIDLMSNEQADIQVVLN